MSWRLLAALREQAELRGQAEGKKQADAVEHNGRKSEADEADEIGGGAKGRGS